MNPQTRVKWDAMNFEVKMAEKEGVDWRVALFQALADIYEKLDELR